MGKVNHAKCQASNIGYEVRWARELWRQTRQEFGIMFGLGLLGEVTVERWEMGIENPPEWVLTWVARERMGVRIAAAVKRYGENNANQSNGGGLRVNSTGHRIATWNHEDKNGSG